MTQLRVGTLKPRWLRRMRIHAYTHTYLHACIHSYIKNCGCQHCWQNCVTSYGEPTAPSYACMHAHARTYIHTCMHAHEQTYTHACRGSAGEGGAASGEAARLLPFGEAASGEAARNEYGAMLCLAVLCHAVPYADSLAVPCCAVCRQICTHMLCRAMPCFNMLYYAMLCHAMPCYAML